MGDSNTTAADDMAAESKIEPAPAAPADRTPSSVESTPEHEGPPPGDETSQDPTPAQPQKRKGGRKPIYATSEERKQRNRQAQAAFRERRTEYIKQLEATIKQNEETLTSLQQSQRTAADECLMLRYKNSLLERILLEKGIDVNAELQIKTGSPILGPGFMPHGTIAPQAAPVPPQLQRAAVQRQQSRRSGGQGFLPKLAPGQQNVEMGFTTSPQGHPTPSSHASSPTNLPTRSPMAMHQGGVTPPTSAVLAQPQAQQYHAYARSSQQQPNSSFYAQKAPPNLQQRPLQRPAQYQNHAGSQRTLHVPMSAGQVPSAFYPSPFQKHIDQLGKFTEQEYDAQESRSMLDHPDADSADHRSTPTSPHQLQGTYPPPFNGDQPHPQPPGGAEYYQQPYADGLPPQHMQSTNQTEGGHGPGVPFGQVIDPDDPMLDADPFGLSASMTYPTSYGQHSQR
ncbi:MAG: hypothetical protein FE78DRAFT_538145 [Acidomyces sp. 'richmondensis']|nr:MAG: hypothetical protein FE78DRAFT_538145 [Acidomyces sp. 'richmondensis']